MKLHWYGHACFMLETAGGRLVLDPYAPGSVPGLSMPALEAEAVLCSHSHHDHGYTRGLRLSGKPHSFSVSTLPSFHDDAKGDLRGENLIHIIDAEGLRFVHLGDLGHLLSPADIARLGQVDVLFIPVGGYYTIDAPTAHSLAEMIGARLTIPMHYRGEAFGYDVISTLSEFTSLCDDVIYHDSSLLELSSGSLPASPRTLVLRCPAD